MPVARSCGLTCARWPDKPEYHVCPICGEDTKGMNNTEPMDEEEARSLVLHLRFEDYYAKWDDVKDPDRLRPDW